MAIKKIKIIITDEDYKETAYLIENPLLLRIREDIMTPNIRELVIYAPTTDFLKLKSPDGIIFDIDKEAL